MTGDDGRLTTLHVDLGRQWRGGQNQALLLVSELRRMGHAAELVAVAGGPLAERARTLGIPVYEVTGRFQAALRLRRLASNSGTGDDIPHREATENDSPFAAESRCLPPNWTRRFDVVHCHDAHGLTAAWCAGMHRRTACVVWRRRFSANPGSRPKPSPLPWAACIMICSSSGSSVITCNSAAPG